MPLAVLGVAVGMDFDKVVVEVVVTGKMVAVDVVDIVVIVVVVIVVSEFVESAHVLAKTICNKNAATTHAIPK